MRSTLLAGLAVGLVASLLAAAAPVQDERLPALTERTLDDLFTAILPSEADEAWRELPWRTTFWEGVIDAQEADKPILLFAMNGHPFGCT